MKYFFKKSIKIYFLIYYRSRFSFLYIFLKPTVFLSTIFMRFVKEILCLRVVKKSLLKIPKRKVMMMAYSSGTLLPKQILKHLRTLVAYDCILRNIQCIFIFHLYFHLNNLQ